MGDLKYNLFVIGALITGWSFYFALWRISKLIPRWIVLLTYEGSFPSDTSAGVKRQHLFYLRDNGDVRGSELGAKRFWTERGAKAAAAELALSGGAGVDTDDFTYMSRHGFQLTEIRVARVQGIL